MESISNLIKEILSMDIYDLFKLAKELEVSEDVILGFLDGNEVDFDNAKKISNIYAFVSGNVKQLSMQFPADNVQNNFGKVLDSTLREMREIIHRRGRYSSRNEALDELSKLIFAHFISLVHENKGITAFAIEEACPNEKSLAKALKNFVKSIFIKYLPSSLSHELRLEDFELIIKPNEECLAKEIVACFEKLTFSDVDTYLAETDVMNEVFGKFLADSFIDEKQLGQYLTPVEVVRFMVKIAIAEIPDNELNLLCNPDKCNEFGLILDPSCGVGSFLTELVKNLHPTVIQKYGKMEARKWLDKMSKEVIVGIDKSERMIRLALSNMTISGLPTPQLFLANSIARHGEDSSLTNSFEGKVRLILTNPPFGAEFTKSDLAGYKIASEWSTKNPIKINSEVLFIERYFDWLTPNGQFLAIIPDSILTNKGIYDDLRKGLSNNIEIRSIISLPSVTFGATGTNTKTSILHARKRNHHITPDGAYFALCNDIGFTITTRNNQKIKTQSGTNELTLLLKEFYSKNQTTNIIRRVSNVEGYERWDAQFHASLPKYIERRLQSRRVNDVFVSDIAELSKDRFDPRKCNNQYFSYIEISDVNPINNMINANKILCKEAPSRARKLVHSGDVLLSTVRPDNRTIGVVSPDQECFVCTTGFAVLHPKKVNPLILAYMLKSDFATAQIVRYTAGVAYPVIDETILNGILLPLALDKIELLNEEAEKLLKLESEIIYIRNSLNDKVLSLIV
jgi:type I restriction-modification system DNA methylase subunit